MRSTAWKTNCIVWLLCWLRLVVRITVFHVVVDKLLDSFSVVNGMFVFIVLKYYRKVSRWDLLRSANLDTSTLEKNVVNSIVVVPGLMTSSILGNWVWSVDIFRLSSFPYFCFVWIAHSLWYTIIVINAHIDNKLFQSIAFISLIRSAYVVRNWNSFTYSVVVQSEN